MCEELKLIQTYLGVWKLEDWDIKTCAIQIGYQTGVYCIKNTITNKLLIGEGILGGCDSRLICHYRGDKTCCSKYLIELEKYGIDNFRLIWIIPEKDEIQRKLIENKLQIHFKNNCYNRPRREYPTQKELLENKASLRCIKKGNLSERIQNYTKVQRNYIDECWESNYVGGKKQSEYPFLKFNTIQYRHHILMYIYTYGNICGISSVIHHKCENKLCVNPEHLELTTHIGNINYHYKINNNKYQIKKYLGVSWHNKDKKFRARYINKFLGNFSTEVEAAQHRDYYIVKNNLLNVRCAKLNFHNINYLDFKPLKQFKGDK